MERQENSRWGFESNRFVCEPRNDGGLGIEFYRDTATDSGATCATARATFVPLGPAQMVDAVGAAVDDGDAEFVRTPRGDR